MILHSLLSLFPVFHYLYYRKLKNGGASQDMHQAQKGEVCLLLRGDAQRQHRGFEKETQFVL